MIRSIRSDPERIAALQATCKHSSLMLARRPVIVSVSLPLQSIFTKTHAASTNPHHQQTTTPASHGQQRPTTTTTAAAARRGLPRGADQARVGCRGDCPPCPPQVPLRPPRRAPLHGAAQPGPAPHAPPLHGRAHRGALGVRILVRTFGICWGASAVRRLQGVFSEQTVSWASSIDRPNRIDPPHNTGSSGSTAARWHRPRRRRRGASRRQLAERSRAEPRQQPPRPRPRRGARPSRCGIRIRWLVECWGGMLIGCWKGTNPKKK